VFEGILAARLPKYFVRRAAAWPRLNLNELKVFQKLKRDKLLQNSLKSGAIHRAIRYKSGIAPAISLRAFRYYPCRENGLTSTIPTDNSPKKTWIYL